MVIKVKIFKILIICTMNKSLIWSDDFAFMLTLGIIKITFNHTVLENVGFFEQFYLSLLLLTVLIPSDFGFF